MTLERKKVLTIQIFYVIIHSESGVRIMTIEYRPDDKIYPYAIYGPWGGAIYTDKDGLKKLQKEIKKILDKTNKA